jgi:hypothetical protein
MTDTDSTPLIHNGRSVTVELQQATSAVKMPVTKGELVFSFPEDDKVYTIPAMGGVGSKTSENIFAECDLLNAGNFVLLTDPAGVRVYETDQVQVAGYPLTTARRGRDQCSYFDFRIHKPSSGVERIMAKPAKESSMNVPTEDSSTATKVAYAFWRNMHDSFNHMKKAKLLEMWPAELRILAHAWPACLSCSAGQAVMHDTRKKKLGYADRRTYFSGTTSQRYAELKSQPKQPKTFSACSIVITIERIVPAYRHR